MKFRFIGTYTNGHTSINAAGYLFEGREPTEVEDAEAIRRISGSSEFEEVEIVHVPATAGMIHEVDALYVPKRRGRKPKAAQ